MRWRPTHTIIALAVALAAVVTPIMVNRQLRRVYEQTLAQWLSKVTPPDRVIIGDSLAAGGGDFGRFGTINRGSTGLVTAQVAGEMAAARAYGARHIIVMTGMNDIFVGTDDPAGLAPNWRTILADPTVIVTLLPHTRDKSLNVRIDRLNAMIAALARQAHRPVIAIPNLTGPDGLRLPQSTYDGIHLTPFGYRQWRGALDAVAG